MSDKIFGKNNIMNLKIILLSFILFLSGCSKNIINEGDLYQNERKDIASTIIRSVNDTNRSFRTTPLVASRNMYYFLLAAYIIYSSDNKEIEKNDALAVALPKLSQYFYKTNNNTFQLINLEYFLKSDEVKEESIAFGEEITDKIIKLAESDNFKNTIKYYNPSKKNKYSWRPTGRGEPGLEPFWGRLRHFDKENKNCILPKPNIDEVIKEGKDMLLNYSDKKAVDEIVLWWLAGIGTDTPGGQWMAILNNLLKTDARDEVTKIKIALSAAAANFDVSIQVWHEKYRHNLLRPESLWEELGSKIVLPRETPNHPSYPSGHSGFASATGSIIKEYYGNSAIFSVLPDDLYYSTQRRDWNSVDEAIIEAGSSRVISGFHYPTDIIAGNKLGSCVAENILSNFNKIIESIK